MLTLILTSLLGGSSAGVLLALIESPAASVAARLIKIACSKEYTEEEQKIARKHCLANQSTQYFILETLRRGR